MCLLFLYINPNPTEGEYRFVAASNRDEFYNRPTTFCDSWPENSNIIGGRDMQPGKEGGTWFAISAEDHCVKLGALLNVTGEVSNPNLPGRGYFVGDYLNSNLKGGEYLKTVEESGIQYNAFNLVTVEISNRETAVYHYSNASKAGVHQWPKSNNNMDSFILGFGNSLFNNPLKKVIRGLENFDTLIEANVDKTTLIEDLIKLLKWKESHWPDRELLRRAPQWAQYLSSVFVEVPGHKYGTRTHNIVVLDYNWKLDFIDVSLDFENNTWHHDKVQKIL